MARKRKRAPQRRVSRPSAEDFVYAEGAFRYLRRLHPYGPFPIVAVKAEIARAHMHGRLAVGGKDGS